MDNHQTPIPWAHVKKLKDTVNNPHHPLPQNLPVQITPWLYLSDEKNARRRPILKELGITHVLSVNEMKPTQAQEMTSDLSCIGVDHKHVGAEDEERYDMLGHWEECKEYLRSVRCSGGKALVHCVAGINRSGFVVCAAHMVLEGKDLIAVVEDCVEKRGTVLWNDSFREQLCVLAAREGLLGEVPEGYTNEAVVKHVHPPPGGSRFKSLFNRL